MGDSPLVPPINRVRNITDISPKGRPVVRGHGEAGAEPQAKGPELMVGEIGEGIEGEGVERIGGGVVLGDEGAVVLESPEAGELLLLGGVSLAVLLAPGLEQIGVRGGERREEEEEKEREEWFGKGWGGVHEARQRSAWRSVSGGEKAVETNERGERFGSRRTTGALESEVVRSSTSADRPRGARDAHTTRRMPRRSDRGSACFGAGPGAPQINGLIFYYNYSD